MLLRHLALVLCLSLIPACQGDKADPGSGGEEADADADADTDADSDADADADSDADTDVECEADSFSAAPTGWSLPDLEGAEWSYTVPFPLTDGKLLRSCGGEKLSYYNLSTFDTTGDSAPDLVLTYDNCDSDVGATRWTVYRGEGAGFASSALDWSLPALEGAAWSYSVPFPLTDGKLVRACGGEEFSYYNLSTFDITGDAIPDLVLTYDNCDSDVGHTRWQVYPGTCP